MNINCGISIVIATKGRVKLLENLVKTIDIARENYDGPTELIIVDDSSESEIAEIKKMCNEHDARYIYLGPSVCAKRNLGARESIYPIVLFLDSDCLVTENILTAHAECYAKNDKVGAVCGLLEFTGDGGKFWDAVSKSQFVVCFEMAKWGEYVPWGTTANFSIRKDVFDIINGFDETFPNKPGGEDVDFGLRIGKAGFKIAAEPKALVYHDKATWTPVKAMFKRVWYYGSADTYIMDKHPDKLIGQLPRRVVLYIMVLLLSIILTFLISPWCLLAFPLWLASDFFGTAAIINKFAPYNRANYREQIVIQSLILTSEAGFVWRCISRGKLKYAFKQLVYFDGQVKGVIFNSSMLTLCLLINTGILAAFLFLVSGYL